MAFVNEITERDEKIIFAINYEENYPRLLDFLKDFPIKHLNKIRPTLDDVFVELSK